MANKELEIALTTYIALKHTQEECIGFIDGYKQCQEDKSEDYHNGYLQGGKDKASELSDKKYTEEDIKKAYEAGVLLKEELKH